MGIKYTTIGAVSTAVVADYLSGSHIAAIFSAAAYFATVAQITEIGQDSAKVTIQRINAISTAIEKRNTSKSAPFKRSRPRSHNLNP